MKKLIRFFKSRGGALLLFLLGLLFFCWPILSITADKGGVGFFVYLFLAWAVLIAILALMGFAIHDNTSDRDEG